MARDGGDGGAEGHRWSGCRGRVARPIVLTCNLAFTMAETEVIDGFGTQGHSTGVLGEQHGALLPVDTPIVDS